MEEPVIVLEEIRKTYKVIASEVSAIDGLSLSVGKGEVFGLLGPNGAGKTSAIKVLLGLILPDAGSGTLLGEPLGSKKAHTRVGFLPEQPYFYSYMTAEKALALYARFFGIRGEALKERTSRLLEMVGLAANSKQTLDHYSKGMVQRFGIAQALLNDPDLLVLDEPASGLDPLGQKEVREILIELQAAGKTIFLSSHQLSEVEKLCDTVTVMNSGRSILEGRLDDLLSVEDRKVVTFSGPTKEGFSAFSDGLRRDGNLTHIEVPSASVYEVIGEGRALGLELLSVKELRLSLEELFLETIGKREK